MPDENGTETTRSDAPSVDESLFGDAADAAAEEQDANEETEQDPPGCRRRRGRGRSAGGPEGRRVHQGRQGHHRGATAPRLTRTSSPSTTRTCPG